MLEINNIEKSYNSFVALKNISLKLKEKELVVLLGPNGAGKSTLFSIITGLSRADEGECFINGNNMLGKHKSIKKSWGSFSATYNRSRINCKRKSFISCRLHGLKFLICKKPLKKN